MLDKTPACVAGNGLVASGGFCQIPHGCIVNNDGSPAADLGHVQTLLDTAQAHAQAAVSHIGSVAVAAAPHVAHVAHVAANLFS